MKSTSYDIEFAYPKAFKGFKSWGNCPTLGQAKQEVKLHLKDIKVRYFKVETTEKRTLIK